MRVLFFTDTYFPQINGVTNMIDKLERYMNAHNIQYRFFAPYYRDDHSCIPNESHVRRFKSASLPFYPECRLSIPVHSNLCRLADKFDPDIVHLMTPAGIGLGGLKYAQERGLPVTSSYTTSFDMYLKYYKLEFLNTFLWGFFKWFHGSCQINFCPSEETSQMLATKGIQNIKLWSRGIDTEFFSPEHRRAELLETLKGTGKTTFLYVGRLAPEKDLDILMESIKAINSLFPDKAQFVMTGDGPYAPHMKKTAPENVIFTGYLKGAELAALYASCNVFVFPSGSETFGNVVLEAMASGLPVIAVNSGGVKDSVIHGYNGLLANPRDVESFTQSIVQFMSRDTLIAEMGANARQFTLKKSWTRIFDQLILDYQGLLAQSRSSAGLLTKIG